MHIHAHIYKYASHTYHKNFKKKKNKPKEAYMERITRLSITLPGSSVNSSDSLGLQSQLLLHSGDALVPP